MADVYFTSFRARFGEGLPTKLKKLIRAAGIGKIDMEGKFAAIKMHFGELGNLAFLRPNYAKAVADTVRELGGKPFLTDCNTMYPGYRKNAIEHLYCAWENGFSPLAAGCPVIIADGLKGTDDIEVPIHGGEYCKTAKIGRAIMDADVFISLSHFKGHEMTGFGGAIKNIGMGCGSRAGKTEQHSSGTPQISSSLCRGCKRCLAQCANGGLVFDEAKRKMKVDHSACVGCSRCIGACNFDAIAFDYANAASDLNCRMAEYAKAVVDGRPSFHIAIASDISPDCDCHSENDAPILPNIGMFASFDPVAIDRACADACLAAAPLAGSSLADAVSARGFVSALADGKPDHFTNSRPGSEWQSCLAHAEKIGLGSTSYTLKRMD